MWRFFFLFHFYIAYTYTPALIHPHNSTHTHTHTPWIFQCGKKFQCLWHDTQSPLNVDRKKEYVWYCPIELWIEYIIVCMHVISSGDTITRPHIKCCQEWNGFKLNVICYLCVCAFILFFRLFPTSSNSVFFGVYSFLHCKYIYRVLFLVISFLDDIRSKNILSRWAVRDFETHRKKLQLEKCQFLADSSLKLNLYSTLTDTMACTLIVIRIASATTILHSFTFFYKPQISWELNYWPAFFECVNLPIPILTKKLQ